MRSLYLWDNLLGEAMQRLKVIGQARQRHDDVVDARVYPGTQETDNLLRCADERQIAEVFEGRAIGCARFLGCLLGVLAGTYGKDVHVGGADDVIKAAPHRL